MPIYESRLVNLIFGVKMKKILLGISVASTVILLSGCTYHSESLDYAKKNNLSEDIYSDVKIQCVTDNKLNRSQIKSNITKEIGSSMYSDCDYASSSMRKSRPQMGMLKYNACIGLANSTNVFSKSEKMNEATTINYIHTKNIYKEKEYGYWGSETIGNKIIIFSHGNIIDKALENYVNSNQLRCDNIEGMK